jgi:phospholipid/cholesterol/gamma-HCH transport system ATP-binding protein
MVLNVNRITLFSEGEQSGDFTNAHFNIFSGQFALVRLNNRRQAAAFGDALSGLLPPAKGSVYFFGRDWQDISADAANAMRGKVGRVFSTGSWLDGYTIKDNILLSQLHHTRRPMDALLREAADLAKRFRLPGLPTGYPHAFNRGDLQRAACVRAFMGHPSLLLLEDPTAGSFQGLQPALINAIGRARNQGAAIWWMTLSDDVWLDESIPADRFFRVAGRDLMEVNRTS